MTLVKKKETIIETGKKEKCKEREMERNTQ